MNILGTGQAYKERSLQALQQSANLEQNRKEENQMIQGAEKQSAVSGIASGAMLGFQLSGGNPLGAGIGAAAGFLSSALF